MLNDRSLIQTYDKKSLKIPKGNQNPYMKKNREHNGQKKKDKRTNNHLQIMHIKLKIKKTVNQMWILQNSNDLYSTYNLGPFPPAIALTYLNSCPRGICRVVKWIVNAKLFYQAIYIIWFTHKNNILRGIVAGDNNIFIMKETLSSRCCTCDVYIFQLIQYSRACGPVISHEWGKDREVLTTSGRYPWSFVTRIFDNGQLSHSGDGKTFEVMTSTY
jgi:hypothetical protein